MENSYSVEDMSSEQKISDHFLRDGNRRYQRYSFGQGLFTKGGGSSFPSYRLVILSLSLLNVVLLIAAVVTGIYCAKAREPQLYYSADGLILAELNHFRNTSAIIRAKVEAHAALVKERASHQQIKLQLEKLKAASDELQSQLETLDKDNAGLKSNHSIFVESCGRCQPKWLLIKSSCYYYSYRYEPDIKKSWQDSRADCISKGGDLLVINNMDEQLFINNNYPRVGSSSGFWWENGHWVGLTHVEGEENWEWITNVTETETMYWKFGQPDQNGPKTGNCAAFSYSSASRHTLYNANCDVNKMYWICEMTPN